jgi:hypothetical protein
MNIKIEVVPQWLNDSFEPGTAKDLSESIVTAHDVNNYLEAQYSFLRELLMLDSHNFHMTLPLSEQMGIPSIPNLFKLLMSHGELVEQHELVDSKTIPARLAIQKAILDDEQNAENSERPLYTMTDSAEAYIMQSSCLKKHVRFAHSVTEDKIFINMSNEPMPGSVALDLSDHAKFRASLIEELLCYIREHFVAVNGLKGNGRVLFANNPNFAGLFSFYISYGL